MNHSKLAVNILKALFTRVLVITHMVLLYVYTVPHEEFLISVLIFIGVFLIIIECFYNIIQRKGVEWKWFDSLKFE